ncbi:hypothetical protein ACFQ1S_03705 [Kibdelosporangium lantanae]|uniref:Uncharacterized protein n=1 Tax=Kibdelosporangium lantanae TaxID=1497396 RepID=A0ABW3M2B7_9PSEU
MVAAAQNADLLYLQHIIALHTPVRGGQLVADLNASDADTRDRVGQRATVRGLPVPHHRVHSDVLVFAQQHDHRTPAAQAFETRVIR